MSPPLVEAMYWIFVLDSCHLLYNMEIIILANESPMRLYEGVDQVREAEESHLGWSFVQLTFDATHIRQSQEILQ